MKHYSTTKLEAVEHPFRRGEWIVRPVHPDGAGYAALTHPLAEPLAKLWANVAALSRNDWELIAAGLELLQPDDAKVRSRALDLELWARAQGWEPGA